MNLEDVYNQFPVKNDCFNYLEQLRWGDNPVCPYCNSKNHTEIKSNNRYHCNTCNTSFSVTVGTMFHKTKIDLQKWFYAIYLIIKTNKQISSRELAKKINTTKDTAWRILNEVDNAFIRQSELYLKILNDMNKP